MLSCQHRPHPGQPDLLSSRWMLSVRSGLLCINPGALWFFIVAVVGARDRPDCSECPASLCSACCVSALLVTHSPGLLFFFFLLSVHYIQAPVSKQKRLLFTGCFSMVRMPELPHQQMRCKVQRACFFHSVRQTFCVERAALEETACTGRVKF